MPGDTTRRLAEMRAAVQRGHALRLRYYSATRDKLSDRVVDPMRVVVAEGRGYLEAWCRSAGAVRLFRLDRIDEHTELDELAAVPPQAAPKDLRDGGFQPAEDMPLVTLSVGRWARWITEYYPCESVVEETPERWLVSLRAVDLAWARRLVLGLGPEVAVVAPAELAAAVRAEARAALAAYEGA
jgi:proteasome accessory factor C